MFRYDRYMEVEPVSSVIRKWLGPMEYKDDAAVSYTHLTLPTILRV